MVLPPNSVPRFYRGGAAIAALRGIEIASERAPEEWVGSATTVFGERELGLSRLPDGRLLRDALAADPVAFLGPGHADRRGADPQLLVKLLDAGERLPVHVHPDGAFARKALDSPYGKTEAWIVLSTADSTATVHLGFRDDVSAAALETWVHDQDAEAMLDALNPVELVAGDALFVPAGTPHAIGADMLLLELQEPSDLSILLEWQGFADGEADASLDLGWDVALGCVDRSRCDPDRLRGGRGMRANGATSLLPPAAAHFFRAERIAASPAAELARGFAILLFIEGAGELHSEHAEAVPVSRGDAVLIPWDAGSCRLEGEAVAVACRPPAADPGAPA